MKVNNILLAFILILPPSLFGILSFETPVIEDTISSETASYDFSFAFKNTGKNTVEIKNISTTCGCTVAKNDKAAYGPQESGEIRGTFTIGDRTGIQEKDIYLETNDLGQSKIKLLLKINIEKDIEFKPSLIFWKKNEDAKEKSVRITLNNAEYISAESDNSNFNVSDPIKGTSGKDLALKVSPTTTAESKRGILKVRYKTKSGAEKNSIVHLLVK